LTRIPELTEIKNLRETLGLSQRQLARECNIQASFVNMIEKGHSDPSYKVLKKIFEYLDLKSHEKLDKLTTAKKICNRPLIAAKKSDNLEDTLKQMQNKDISQIPVLESGGCIGLVTEHSLVKFLGDNGTEKLASSRVKDVMEIPPPILDEDSKITKNIINLIHDSRCILVAEKGKPFGIITKIDLVRSLINK
jgi:predicted transcriptional regulator